MEPEQLQSRSVQPMGAPVRVEGRIKETSLGYD